ncbi:MAG: alpha-N-acetylgalactosaminidase [Candidatus Omnitrophota bacterium]|jgi:predicted dehydrogenase|nr:MAG: alpha-N-acetylgalactosaminidase [Candidatus Omnitrophota bacterium]
MNEQYHRRNFLKIGAAVSLGGIAFSGQAARDEMAPASFVAPPLDVVRVGYVGVGGQGSGHVRNLLNIEGVEIRAVCDIVEAKVERIQDWVVKAGQARPDGYSRGETDFLRLCDRDDIDLVYTATPWEWHVPVCTAAMERGKHAATEVPAAVTLDECWQLVETAEKTRRHCVMMENCCYGRSELMVLHMVRKGLFGELLHGEAGYMHDLRRSKLRDRDGQNWRAKHSASRNGNLYPTHGLGPIAQCMNINRGDRFDFLVSMSTKTCGLPLLAKELFGPDHPMVKGEYALGDVNSSLIRTVNGCTLIVQHDCDTPRPYSRINLVQGTKGIFQGYPDRIYLEGITPGHEFEPADPYFEKYEHPLWKNVIEKAKGAGHGGMDYIEDYRLVQALRTGSPTDMDVYDAADWSVVSALSEESVAHRSRPVDFPDFTRGAWKIREPLGILEA